MYELGSLRISHCLERPYYIILTIKSLTISLLNRLNHKAAIKVLTRDAVTSSFNQRRIHFQVYLRDCWRASSPHWLLVRNISSLPGGPLQGATHNTATCFLHSENREGEGNQSKGVKRQARRKIRFFCNLILEMTSQHFCYFVFIRSESPGAIHIQGEIDYTGHAYEIVEIIGGHPRRWPLQGMRKRRPCGISEIGKDRKGPGLENFCLDSEFERTRCLKFNKQIHVYKISTMCQALLYMRCNN